MTSCQGHSFATRTLKSEHLHLTRSEEDIAAMTTLIRDPTVSGTTLAHVPVYNPPPATCDPRGQQTTPTSQSAPSGSGENLLSHVSVRSDQVAVGDKCMFTLSPGHFAAVYKYRGRVLIHVKDYSIDALSDKMFATKRGVAMKVDEWEVEHVCY